MKTLMILCLLATVAAADAAHDNEDGKAAMIAHDYGTAVTKFRAAAKADPQAKYFFNLCAALYSTGEFRPAFVACQRVAQLKPDERLQRNARSLIDKIKSDAKAQHISLAPDARR